MFKKQTVPYIDAGETVKNWPLIKQRTKFIYYPWHLWTNGKIWKVNPTGDLQVNFSTFKAHLINHAKQNNLKLKTRSNLKTLWFQFTKKGINDE